MHVRVDEPGAEEAPAAVDALAALVRADTREATVGDRDVALEPLARERAEHLRALDHRVGRLVTTRDGQQAGGRRRVVHAGTVTAARSASCEPVAQSGDVLGPDLAAAADDGGAGLDPAQCESA